MDTSKLLNEEVITDRLQTLNVAWAAIGNDYLVRTYQTKDFDAGVALIKDIAKLANEANHHPDISLSYNRLEVKLSTHDIAGITDKDFALAAKIDQLAQS